MAYGITTHVAAPVGMYDALHAALLARTGPTIDGLLVHIGRPAEDGFDVVEVWESREHFDRYNRELIAPLIAEMAGEEGASAGGDQQIEEFEVRGLVTSGSGVRF